MKFKSFLLVLSFDSLVYCYSSDSILFEVNTAYDWLHSLEFVDLLEFNVSSIHSSCPTLQGCSCFSVYLDN